MESRIVIRRLQKDGWYIVRIRGSHYHFHHADKEGTCTVPHPRKSIPLKTLKSIEKQSGVKLT